MFKFSHDELALRLHARLPNGYRRKSDARDGCGWCEALNLQKPAVQFLLGAEGWGGSSGSPRPVLPAIHLGLRAGISPGPGPLSVGVVTKVCCHGQRPLGPPLFPGNIHRWLWTLPCQRGAAALWWCLTVFVPRSQQGLITALGRSRRVCIAS